MMCNLSLKYVQKKYNKVQRPSFKTNFVGLNNASNNVRRKIQYSNHRA